MIVAGLVVSCASSKKETVVISPYKTPSPEGLNALVYGLPQTRLYFDVEMVKTIVKKGPYAEYANRMLGLQSVPMKDSETWQIKSIRIREQQEVDNRHLYTVSFTNYPQNLDHLLRFTKAGLILDVTVANVLVANQIQTISDDLQFVNVSVTNTLVEKVDTIHVDTTFMQVPVLQTKVMSKTTEEQARETAQQIFNIRKTRLSILIGDTDYHPDGAALKLIFQSLDKQESQLLSLFAGLRVENRRVVSFPVLPEKQTSNADLCYFSERAGIVSKNTPGAKAVWYEIGKAETNTPFMPIQQASNIIYYRIPQVVEISAGVDRTTLVRERITVYQWGNIVSFPLAVPKK